MKINNLEKFREKIAGGKVAMGCVITFADHAVTEIAADSGFDFVWIDGEHGEMDRVTAMSHIMAIRGTDCAPLYRVPCCDHTEIKKVIDFAPAGIIVPMVMNAEDAALAVAACRYPPEGNRGCGFRRGSNCGADDVDGYWEAARREPLVIIQMEHIEAYRNLDAILAVPGVDAILIGPYDFTASMNKRGQWHDPEVAAAFDEVCRKTREAGLMLGVYTECDFDIWKKRGVNFMAIKNDTGAMINGFRFMLKRAEEA
ncbi:MAG: hypothetical protein J6S21_04340 [Victivallales bacterium]|nr:hypothetical protein [Victivallales bacterium]